VPPPPPSKKDVALALLEKGSIFVHLDPRRDKVVVPKAFWVQSELVLQFGTEMRVPVADLDLDDEGISGTLSFARRPFWCRVPWAAVFAIVGEDRRGAVWSQDAPPENKSIKGERPPEPKRSHLRAVPSPSDAPVADKHEAPPSVPRDPAGAAACSFCATPWAEEATSCPVCGAAREASASPAPAEVEPAHEAPVASQAPVLQVATEEKREPNGDDVLPDDPPPDPPLKRSHLRLVK
jgi:stringent starvation protein B